MKTVDWRAWLWQYGAPLLLFVAALVVMAVLMSLTGEDLDLLWLLVVFPVLALGCGFVVQPRRSWVVPLVLTTGMIVAGAVSMYGLGLGPVVQPSPVTFVLTNVLLEGVLLTFLIWIGRTLRQGAGIGFGRRRQGPRTPAT